jgi:hypothetical protein
MGMRSLQNSGIPLITSQTAANFDPLGGNAKKGFLVGGISAGGNFAAIVSHLYRDDKLSPSLTGSYLSIPACISLDFVPAKYRDVYLSREQNTDVPVLNREAMEFFGGECSTHFYLTGGPLCKRPILRKRCAPEK